MGLQIVSYDLVTEQHLPNPRSTVTSPSHHSQGFRAHKPELWLCCCSVTQLCPVCNPMDCSILGFPVLHHLIELAQTHVHWVGDPSNHLVLCCPLLLLPSIFLSIRIFSNESAFTLCGQSIGASALASVLPMNMHGWFPFRLTGLISLQSKGLSRVFSRTIVWKHQFFHAQPSLWSNSHLPIWLLEKL